MDKETVNSQYLSGGEDRERLYSIAMYLLWHKLIDAMS